MPLTTAPVALERLDSPIGRIEVVGDGSAIISLAIECNGALPHDGHPDRPDAITSHAVEELREYFAGERRTFTVPVRASGTAFQSAVWAQLDEIPWGEVLSYGEIGIATGRPTAGRAVGGAVGANPVPLLIPCHRVLGGSGRITGYSAGDGIRTKAWLLEHEGIPHTLPRDADVDTLFAAELLV